MKPNHGLISLALLFLCSNSFAAKPIFIITPLQQAPEAIIDGQTLQATYTITNNTPYTLTDNGVVNLPEGVTQTSYVLNALRPNTCAQRFKLAPGASCTLVLSFNGSLITQDIVNAGPVICHTPANQVYCSRPSASNDLNVKKVSYFASAVGYYFSNTSLTNTPLLYNLSSSRWVLEPAVATPAPAGQLKGAYCQAALDGNACTAVGTSGNNLLAYYAAQNGNWAESSTQPQAPTGQEATLNGVACNNVDQASQQCIAVGTNQTHTTPLSYTSTNGGKDWKDAAVAVTLPHSATSGGLNAIACDTTAATTCIAVGTAITSAQKPLVSITTDGGSTWSSSILATEASTDQVVLNGISCTKDALSCVAVGTLINTNTPPNNTAPIMYYSSNTGESWTLVSSVNGAANVVAQLTSVTCQTSGNCAAVGSYTPTTNTILPWAIYSTDFGQSWTVSSTLPQAPTATITAPLGGVVCDPAYGLVCSALGEVLEGTNQVLAYSSNNGGQTWVTNTIPQPAGTMPQINGVH